MFIVFAPEKSEPRSIFAFALVFMLLLPLVNALWDWLSLGFTRWALKLVMGKGQGKRGGLRHGALVFWSCIDLLAAGFFLTGLALSMTLIVELPNLRAMSAGGPPLLDLGQLFARLRDTPGDVAIFWVYITLFSTFLPTLAHLLVMSTALFTWGMPKGLRTGVLKMMDKGFKGDVCNQILVAAFFSGRLVVAALLVIAGLSFVGLVLWLPGLGKLLLYLCSEVQQWINPGAAPVYESRPPLIRVIEV